MITHTCSLLSSISYPLQLVITLHTHAQYYEIDPTANHVFASCFRKVQFAPDHVSVHVYVCVGTASARAQQLTGDR